MYLIVAAARIPFAWTIEQLILNATVRFRRTILGKGGTEVRPWYVGVPCMVLVWALGLLKWAFLLAAPFWVSALVVWVGEGL